MRAVFWLDSGRLWGSSPYLDGLSKDTGTNADPGRLVTFDGRDPCLMKGWTCPMDVSAVRSTSLSSVVSDGFLSAKRDWLSKAPATATLEALTLLFADFQ